MVQQKKPVNTYKKVQKNQKMKLIKSIKRELVDLMKMFLNLKIQIFRIS